MGSPMGSGRGAASMMRWTLSMPASYRKQVNWVLDADIQGFFDAMAHSWIIRFLEHRIADKRILRLIAKWLKVGVVEDGRVNTWRMWRSARRGDLTDPGERLSALCVRSMGPSLAPAPRASGDMIVTPLRG